MEGGPSSIRNPFGPNAFMNHPTREWFHAPRFESEKNLDGEGSREQAFCAKSREVWACELPPCRLTQNKSIDFKVNSLVCPLMES